ncbi:hypothetical protein AYL99_12118 [Fonsecaea erecta]|uniref:Uncharacterized protein n=1 Tax=Fonsecaea erecta TaxID=1367422 RepID=A0A178Z3P7_9EURO|nr:hypothetical protein AYL99_12118 [Fonsecaea erecta]OAP53705.1 hypothetical protein AYL99_12118 [Fonsecaea erecta]
MALTHPTPCSPDVVAPPIPPPSPCYESFGRQLRNDYIIGIGIQPMSDWNREGGCIADPSGPGQEDEELSDSDRSSFEGSSVFSDLSSNVDGRSIYTVFSEDEDYAEIERIAFHVQVETQVFERDGVIPGSEVPSSDKHSHAAEELIDALYTLVRLSIEAHSTVDLDTIIGNILQVPSITPLNDRSWEILYPECLPPNFAEQTP